MQWGGKGILIQKDRIGALSTLNNQSVCMTVDEKMGNTYIHEDCANTMGARDYKQPQAVCYGIDRAAFNQGQNAQFGFSIDEELAQPGLAKGWGGVLTKQ